MKHNLVLVTQTACSLILSMLLNKCARHDSKIQLISLLCHIHSQHAVAKKVYDQ